MLAMNGVMKSKTVVGPTIIWGGVITRAIGTPDEIWSGTPARTFNASSIASKKRVWCCRGGRLVQSGAAGDGARS